MSNEDYKYFVKSFVRFLQKQTSERNFSPDIIESLEVATQCLEAAYEISMPNVQSSDVEIEQNPNTAGTSSNDAGTASDMKKTALENIDLFELFQEAYLDKIPDKKHKAEEVKNEGNRLMKEGKYNEALVCYNKAITLDATNPVFYCNRAAAKLRLSEFEKAVADCKMSLLYNPNYSKAYGRMGIAYSNLNKFDNAIEVYKKALELEPDNVDYQNNLEIAQKSIVSNNTMNPLLDFIMRQQPSSDGRNLLQNILSGEIGDDPDIMNAIRNGIEMANFPPGRFEEIISYFVNMLQDPYQGRQGSNNGEQQQQQATQILPPGSSGANSAADQTQSGNTGAGPGAGTGGATSNNTNPNFAAFENLLRAAARNMKPPPKE